MMTMVLAASPNAAATCDLLVFDVGRERFAMPLASVEEVVDGCATEVHADVSARYRILRVRHELLAAFDPDRALMTSRSEPEPVALVLPSLRGFVALLVDAAFAVPQADVSCVRTPPGLLATDRVLEGVLRVGDRWVGLVNTAALVDALLVDVPAPSQSGQHGR